MAQTLFKATGVTADNSGKIKDAGMAVAGVKWININGDNVVITHEDGYDEGALIEAVKSAGVEISK